MTLSTWIGTYKKGRESTLAFQTNLRPQKFRTLATMARLSSVLWLSLLPVALSSPLINGHAARQAPANASAILQPQTLAAIQNITTTMGIPGGIIAISSPKGDGVLTFGNRTVEGDPVTPDVSLL